MDLQVRSQSANRKSEDRKRPSWSSAVFAAALPFAFCALPFDLFFAPFFSVISVPSVVNLVLLSPSAAHFHLGNWHCKAYISPPLSGRVTSGESSGASPSQPALCVPLRLINRSAWWPGIFTRNKAGSPSGDAAFR